MIKPASSGKAISVIVAAGAIVTGYILQGKRQDRRDVIESRNAIQAKRDLIAAQKDRDKL
jgi:hypothetical protein